MSGSTTPVSSANSYSDADVRAQSVWQVEVNRFKVSQLDELLRAKGDDLGEERVRALFSSVSRGQPKIGFEKYYQAVNDAARESRESGGGGGFSNPFAGLFGK